MAEVGHGIERVGKALEATVQGGVAGCGALCGPMPSSAVTLLRKDWMRAKRWPGSRLASVQRRDWMQKLLTPDGLTRIPNPASSSPQE